MASSNPTSPNATPAATPRGPHHHPRDGKDGSEDSSEVGVNEAGSLLFAVSRAKLNGLRKLLDTGLNVNAQDYDGRCALHLAAASGKREFIQLLLDRGAKVDLADRWGRTPLDDATLLDHQDAIKLLMHNGAKHGTNAGPLRPQTLDPKSTAAIMLQASAEGDVERVKKLLDSKEANVDLCDYDKRTSCHLAASEGKLDMLKLLVDRGAQVNLMDRWGNRCLNDALRGNHQECIQFLRSMGK